MRLLLFDIDLTLIHTSGAGRHAIDVALAEVLGVERPTEGVVIDGRTDRGIFVDVLERHGRSAELADEAMELYLAELPRSLEVKGGHVLPGVRELLEALSRERAALGLATGNMVRGAEIKLSKFGLWECFKGGGFGDHSAVRSEVILAAVEDIAREHGVAADARNALVIGDTPRDVEAAHAAGVRALAVATGRYSVEELRESGADMAVEDLRDTERVVELLLGDGVRR